MLSNEVYRTGFHAVFGTDNYQTLLGYKILKYVRVKIQIIH